MENTDKIKIVVKKINTLNPKEKESIKKFLIEVFANSVGYSDCVYTSPDLELCILVYIKNNLVGHLGITRKTVNHNEKIYQIGGVGDVAILKNKRNLGIGSLILDKCNQTLKKNNFDLGLLFCHPDLYKFYSSGSWIQKENGLIYATVNGVKEDQMFTCFLPIKLDQKDIIYWNNNDIDVGVGSW
jgi:predicted N-acetyltransferase YhbS